MEEKAFAKINLGLDILGSRPDGYHEVSMIMQTVGLCDVLTFSAADHLVLTCNQAELPCDKTNLVWRAAELLAERIHKKPNVHIHIEKHIFLAAGLAGGSSDAAAVLRGLNKFWQAGLNVQELLKLGSILGSDVPFCLQGGTAKAIGRGEQIIGLPDLPPLWVVLAKPRDISVGTAWAYRRFDSISNVAPVRIEILKTAIQQGKLELIFAAMGNVLEDVTIPAYPVLQQIKNTMLQAGAAASMMSGSGPTVFGLCRQKAEGEKVVAALRNKTNLEVVLTKTVQRRECNEKSFGTN